MLYTTRKQLALDLCYLASEDKELLNDIIIDYLSRLDDNDIDGLETYVNKEIQSIL